MAEVVPTITADSVTEYTRQIDQVKPFAKRLHIDVADGVFVDRKLVGLDEVHGIEGVPFDLHLMMSRPEGQAEKIIALQPELVIIHFEAKGDHNELVSQLRTNGIKVGLAIKPETTVEEVAKILPTIDHLLVFTGGHIGFFGGEFRTDCLAKIKQARAINSELEIAVDGGIDIVTGRKAFDAGADVLDCGSFIQDAPEPETAYRGLSMIAEATS
jgi:ribulose-phosphate 3-epimerase